jgi:endonuclease/exonuclease/phosphatase family metal-dependent hydrolase
MEYYRLRFDFRDAGERARVISNLEALRAGLDKDIPPKDQDHRLLLATWNVRDLGKDYLKSFATGFNRKKMRRGAGPRSRESLYYIAEIISRFDFVAVQEVNDIEEWEIVVDILGRDWDYIATDVTDGRLGGNDERLLFAFDKRKVFFRKIAGEVVLPNALLVTDAEATGEDAMQGKQFRRTPFLASFQAGWFRFDICTVHIYYGEGAAGIAQRTQEIDRVAGFLAKYAEDALKKSKTLFLLGDFNIVSPEHKTMTALKNHGFRSPGERYFKTNVSESMYYDQIAYLAADGNVDFGKKATVAEQDFGVFRFFDYVYKAGQAGVDEYAAQMALSEKGTPADLAHFRDWRTYQMSDHVPLWVRLSVNDSRDYLARLKAGS